MKWRNCRPITKNHDYQLGGAILAEWQILKHVVVSAAEAEVTDVLSNAKPFSQFDDYLKL